MIQLNLTLNPNLALTFNYKINPPLYQKTSLSPLFIVMLAWSLLELAASVWDLLLKCSVCMSLMLKWSILLCCCWFAVGVASYLAVVARLPWRTAAALLCALFLVQSPLLWYRGCTCWDWRLPCIFCCARHPSYRLPRPPFRCRVLSQPADMCYSMCVWGFEPTMVTKVYI